MVKETTQKIFGPFTPYKEWPVTVVAETAGGTVAVEMEVGDNNWVIVKTFSSNGADAINVRGMRIRITPTGAAGYVVYGAN
jgi:hypothetical protein